MFDGKVARMCKRTEEEKQFGIQIDSLADTINFIALPVVIMLSLGMNSVLDIKKLNSKINSMNKSSKIYFDLFQTESNDMLQQIWSS